MATPITLTVAMCLSDEVTLPDFITPVEILAALNAADNPIYAPLVGEVSHRVAIDYLHTSMDPIVSSNGRNGPSINPTLTYADAMASGKQFDVLWIPAGPLPNLQTGESRIPPEEIAFIAQQAAKAKYLASVCTGSYQLALAGVLSGKRATTNKAFYRVIEGFTPKDINWVPKARWVVDGNIWTSSGVTAGADMALAFVEHVAGAKIARFIRGGLEIPEVTDQDDPFAAWHGLV